jgi:putative transposase
MDNHVHFIAVPKEKDSFGICFKEAHKQYTRMINFRQNWRGHLWEGRFKSCVLSEKHLYAAIRYVERNPIRAGIVKKAEDYPWSSARAHVDKKKDLLISDNFMIQEISDWTEYLAEESGDINLFNKHANTGRPLGDKEFILTIEKLTRRCLIKKNPGPKRIIK